MKTKAFEDAYKKLNKEQKKAVDTIDGPVMVVAGPGTGKTQILTLRIANILLKTDTEPENILALTFTESGVQSMRKRLAELIGSGAYQVTISTFHGFANDVIKNNPEEFPHIIGSRSITEIDQIAVIEEIILETDTLDLLKPFGDTLYFVRAINGAISELKREGISVKQFTEIIKNAEKEFKAIDDLYYDSGAHKGKMKGKYKDLEKQINKNAELSVVYAKYQEKLQERKFYDYNDMIMETLRALESNDDLLLRLQEEYQYMLVDEHQDTNNAQNKIIELMASHFAPKPNLFVVGDEKQSIFRFQGASLENFYYFKHLYPEAELVALKENYRSQQSILDSAHSLITTETKLSANVGHEIKPIELYALGSRAAENYFIARDIKGKIDGGVDPHEIAVLYRDNKDAFPVADILKKIGVPFQIESDLDIFAHSSIKKLLLIAESVSEYGNDRKLADVLHLDIFDINPLDAFKLLRSASQKRKHSLFDVISNEKMLQEVELENRSSILETYTKIAHWVKRSKNADLIQFFEEILRESGLLQQILSSEDAQDKLDVLDGFFEELRAIITTNPGANLSDFFSYLDTVKTHNIYIKKKKTGGREGKVRLMTAHRSKGLEFEYVYVINAVNGKWGNKRRPELMKLLPEVYSLIERDDSLELDKNDDERRLFYVALTRAKKHAILTYSREAEDGREMLPTQFIGEIDQDLISVIDPAEVEKEFEIKRGEILNTERKKQSRSLKDQAFVKELFLKQGMSVSALNNYLSCPWKYFYRNLIRLPEPVMPHLMYGTAMHDTLEQLFKKLRFEEKFDKKDVINYFKKQIETHPFLEEDKIRYGERGEKALSGWYDEYGDRWIANTLTEFAIRGIELTPEIRLTGKLDKLEMLSEREVNVVDYKTGKPKTRNQILGKTKSGDANIWRQIVFYKLLLDKFKDGKYEMVSGEIDFVEPDSKNGKYRKEKFIVETEDVEDLVETIQVAAEEIMTLKFWDRHCDDSECEYCELRKLIR